MATKRPDRRVTSSPARGGVRGGARAGQTSKAKAQQEPPSAPKKSSLGRGAAKDLGKRSKKTLASVTKTGQTTFNETRAHLETLASRQVVVGKDKRNSMSLGMIVALIILTLIFVAPPAFTYISTYQESLLVTHQLQEAQAKNRALRDLVARWQDETYVENQARKRLGYVKSGQTRYRVVDPDPKYLAEREKAHEDTPKRPWFVEMQVSVAQAGTEKLPEPHANKAPASTDGKKPADGKKQTQPTDKTKENNGR